MPWLQRALASAAFAAEVAGAMFLVCSAPLFAWAWSRGVRDPAALVFGLGPPAAAGLSLTLLAFLMPALASDQRLRFPLTVTLPALFTGLSLAFAKVLATLEPPLALLGEQARLDQVWSRLDVAVVEFALLAVALAAFSAVMPKRSVV